MPGLCSYAISHHKAVRIGQGVAIEGFALRSVLLYPTLPECADTFAMLLVIGGSEGREEGSPCIASPILLF